MPIIRIAMRLCALLIVGGLLTAPVAAQSLADVARKEAERRDKVKESGKTYTNQDLKAAPAAAADTASSTTDQPSDGAKPADTADSGGASKAADKDSADGKSKAKSAADKEPVKDQAYWSKRMTELRDQLGRDQVYMEALQSRVNALTTDFVNRDDPVQRAQIASDRQRAIDELARLKKGTEEDKKAIADLEEEARRASVPPGWLR